MLSKNEREQELAAALNKLKTGQMTRREFMALVGALGMTAGMGGMLSGCGPAPTAGPEPTSPPAAASAVVPTTGAPTEGPSSARSIAITINSDLSTMDPHMQTLREAMMAYFCIFETLMTRDVKTMTMKPLLATSWNATSPTTWEMELRQGVKFSNGEDFNASTVKFNIERVLNPDQQSPIRGHYLPIQKVDILDDYKVLITTDQPWALFEERLSGLWILPEKLVKEQGDEYLVENAVGTGPYKFVRWTRGTEVLMERRPDYWGEPAAFETAVVRIIPEITTAIAELLAGRVQIVRGVSPDQIAAIDNSGVARAVSSPTLAVSWTQLDAQGRANPGNPFTDKRVRQACNYACNIDGYVEAFQTGGERCPGGLNPLHFGFDSNVEPYTYDVEKAKQLLAEAGWTQGSDGVLVKDGERFEVRFNTGASRMPGRKQVNEAIAQDLAKVGIKVEIEHIEDVAPYTAKITENKVAPMFQWDWGSYNVFDADAIYWDNFHSGQNFAYFSTPELDGWLEEARSTLDREKRLELYAKAQSYLNEESPCIWMWAVHNVKGVSNDIEWEPCADDLDRLTLAKPKA
jgi:peptide/nickel transport system substrate-binding protein